MPNPPAPDPGDAPGDGRLFQQHSARGWRTAAEEDFRYDVFVSYRWREPGLSWVRGTLVPRLRAEGFEVCIDYQVFRIGARLIGEITRAVEQSRCTLVILTPAYLESGFTELENVLARHLGRELGQRRLLAVLREACQPPQGIDARLVLDMTDDEMFEVGFARLAAALRDRDPSV